MADKIFVDGLISKEVADTAPDFILGKLSINIDNLKAFLDKSKGYAVNGWLNATILKSKGGKRYIELDLYQWNKDQEKKMAAELEGIDQAVHTQSSTMTSVQPDGTEPINLQDVPF